MPPRRKVPLTKGLELHIKSYSIAKRPRLQTLKCVNEVKYLDKYAEPSCGLPCGVDNDVYTLSDATTDEALAENTKTSYTQAKSKEIDFWKALENELLEVQLSKEVPPGWQCSLCTTETSNPIKCFDCNHSVQWCTECEKKCHENIHFHKPQVWKDGKFTPYIMKAKVISRTSHECESSSVENILVVDDQGRLHYNVLFVFCGCESKPSTLLRHGLWSSSPSKPSVAFSMNLLQSMTLLMFESAVSTKGFVQMLRWRNKWSESQSNQLYRLLIGECLSAYRNFYRRYTYYHLEMSNLSSAMKKCPACPQDGGVVTICMDGNFGLVRKCNSGTSPRPSSAIESFFLDSAEVNNFVNNYQNDKQKDQECSTFLAGDVVRSNARNARLDVRGVFGSVCRHEFPVLFMDMKHGERLAYPVYLLNQLRQLHGGSHLQVIYDIGCIMSRHLQKSSESDMLQNIDIGLPIFHSYGHGPSCQVNFSVRYLKGFGLTDGEGTERLWSYLRPLSSITKEMTPVHRVEVLNDALLHFCLRKTANLAKWFGMRGERAFRVHKEAYENVKQVKLIYSVSDEDLTRWVTEQKDQLQRKKKENSSLNAKWEMVYAKKVQSYYSAHSQLLFCSDTTLLGQLTKKLNELDSSLKKTESAHHIERWQTDHLQYVHSIHLAAVTEREKILRQLFTDSSAHAFTLGLLKKYCDGQTVYIRLNKQMKRVKADIQKGIQMYNSVLGMCATQSTLPSSITEKEVMENSAFACIAGMTQDDGIPLPEKWRAVEQLMIRERAVEETQRVKDDILTTCQHLLRMNSSLSATAEETCASKRSLILSQQSDLHDRMRSVWHVAFKYLNEVPPLPTMPTFECVDTNNDLFLDLDGYSAATLDDVSSDSDGDESID